MSTTSTMSTLSLPTRAEAGSPAANTGLCASTRKLYLPYSALRSLEPQQSGRDLSNVMVHWFRAEREEPIGAYASLILGHKGLTDEVRSRAEAMVDEFFREDEFHLLREYFQNRHGELRVSMLVAPVSALKPDTGTRAGGLRPFSMPLSEREEVTIHRLTDEPGYSLPFAVWGASVGSQRGPSPSKSVPIAEALAADGADAGDDPEAEEA